MLILLFVFIDVHRLENITLLDNTQQSTDCTSGFENP